MNITEVRIRHTYHEGRLQELVSVIVGGDFAIHEIKVIEGDDRLFIAMPSRKDDDGAHRDIAHPVKAEGRAVMEKEILAAYHEHLVEEKPWKLPSRKCNWL